MATEVLVLGSGGPRIRELVGHLREQGFWPASSIPETFTSEVEHWVYDFQRTHLGPDGRFLQVDGVVGPKTWWALRNAAFEAQRSHLVASVPRDLTPLRARVLQVALGEHEVGVCESPNGSNRGPELDKYLPDWITEGRAVGPAWCCFFYSWVVKTALGHWPLKQREGSCQRARARAGELKLWTVKGLRGERPFPADAFVMDRGGGHGHIGFVLRVSEDGARINTLEGNCGNRVKLGLRELSDPEIIGFIDNVPSESSARFERGVVDAPALGRDSTR